MVGSDNAGSSLRARLREMLAAGGAEADHAMLVIESERIAREFHERMERRIPPEVYFRRADEILDDAHPDDDEGAP